ncbi:hypothetical protein [Sphingobium yanoikuyae]|uniref:Lipoprotein n=1 Tax=Sphingobium yanoikuyae TaxID=13690 RepID=A0A291N5C5_SPHYA|nr:hypothetical protein [Sphingobium yanoikuyae]ATI82435.1 hypothetical protein A6768_22150 [Sphingobium yanoikuyae]
MTRHRLWTVLTLPVLLSVALAACSGEKSSPADNAADNAVNAVENAMANAANATNAAAPSADAFSQYVGKYPFDKVGAHSWSDDPAVVAAVKAAVADKAVRKWVLEEGGPASPIATVDGKIAAWSCETHNCGPHQWLTLVDPASGTAEVCYYDEAVDAQSTRWFKAGQEEKRPGQCPDVSN